MPPRKNTPANQHASIAALMLDVESDESAEDVIRRKCRELVAYGKSKGWSGPAYDPTILASILGVQVEPMPEPWDGDGRIFSRHGRTVIQFRPDQIPERQRFTVCHEIAHTCFPDYFEFVRKHEANPDSGDPAHRKFEKLCNVGAGELLMPHEEFSADMGNKKVCLQHAHDLGIRYGASIDAAVKRLLDLTEHPCAVAFLTDLGFAQFSKLPGRFRVRWFWKSRNFKGYLPTGTLCPNGSCALTASLQNSGFRTEAKETWWPGNKPRTLYTEAVRLQPIPQNAEYPCVIALLHARQQH